MSEGYLTDQRRAHQVRGGYTRQEEPKHCKRKGGGGTRSKRPLHSPPLKIAEDIFLVRWTLTRLESHNQGKGTSTGREEPHYTKKRYKASGRTSPK